MEKSPGPVGRITVRRSADRGRTSEPWLDSRHTFSFDDYHDPRYMGFLALRVINEDRVAPEKGFPTHPHRDMEILTYVVEGTLEHRDSMGNGSAIRVGDIQKMSAGTGVTHSEYNPSPVEAVHLLQIWITPDRLGLEPSYEQFPFPVSESAETLLPVASRKGGPGIVRVSRDASIFRGFTVGGNTFRHEIGENRGAWLQVIEGRVGLEGEILEAGDGAALQNIRRLALKAGARGHFLLFELGGCPPPRARQMNPRDFKPV